MMNAQVKRVTVLETDLPKTIISGWLSPRTSYTVSVIGQFGEKEAAALMRLLTAQLDVLKDAPSAPSVNKE